MITITQIAEYIENQLNALVPNTQTWAFKIWANAGERTKTIREGNTVYYTIDGTLQSNSSGLDPNVLVMGVNSLTLNFNVPTEPPRSNAAQSSSILEEIQAGQIYFINLVSGILTTYFTKAQSFTLTDASGNGYGVGMYAGVAIPSVVDISRLGRTLPMSVSITLNFVEGGINALDIKVYVDGQRLPYKSFSPSRSGQLATSVQSNASKQTSVETSALYGASFTCPSVVNNYACAAALNIVQGEDINTAHFLTVEWGTARTDTRLVIFNSATAMASGADFAGLTVNLTEAYEPEYLNYPDGFVIGAFACTASTLPVTLSFTINANISVTYANNATVPDSVQFFYYIAGKAYSATLTSDSVNGQTATYSGTITVSIVLEAEDYVPTDSGYDIYLVMSGTATISNVSSVFTYVEL